MPLFHEVIRSPWKNQFLELAGSARCKVIATAPFITRDALVEFVNALRKPDQTEVVIGTTFAADSVAHGFLDLNALLWACVELPRIRVNHVPRLHAKVYISDNVSAIVTSGNLTMASLLHNNEYGVRIFDRDTVIAIERDVEEYMALGAPVTCDSIGELTAVASKFRKSDTPLKERNADMELQLAIDEFENCVRHLRGTTNESRTAIFAKTILHALRSGPMKTADIHEMVRGTQPDLCDDDIERIINGVRFGKRWKHDVRNAQQMLKRRGKITLLDSR